MQLRYYQRAAIDAAYSYLRQSQGNPCIVLPTGAGKTPVIATIISDAVNQWGGRVCVLAHRKELLEQTREKILLIDPSLDVGVYSASLKSRDKSNAVILAGIQSVYNKSCEFGRFDLILIDEAHLIPPSGEGMYQTFLRESLVVNPHVRAIGLTATPYRTSTGKLCGPDNILNEICYDVSIPELIAGGFLSPLISKCAHHTDTTGLHVRKGEFVSSEAEDLMMSILGASVKDLITRTKDRHSVLIFAQGIAHAEQITERINDAGRSAEMVIGDTLPRLRELAINRFRRQELKYLVNVDVLTTGFDATNIDAVALMRPTMSPGLYYQMVGRGLRIDDTKADCLILDYASNIQRHGPVDCIIPDQPRGGGGSGERKPSKAPVKECPECQSMIALAYERCPDCGYMFTTEDGPKHDATPDESEVLSHGLPTDTEYDVIDVSYHVHVKRNAQPDSPKTMRVTYHIGNVLEFSEWVCVEHDGFAGEKARKWWTQRSMDLFPVSAEHAVLIAEAGGIANTEQITVREKPGEKYPSIIAWEIGEMPAPSAVDEPSKPTTVEDEWNTNLAKTWSQIDPNEVPF